MTPQRLITKALQPVMAALRASSVQGKITAWNDTTLLPTCTITTRSGETLDDVHVFGQFGFGSQPPAGTPVECIVLGLGGRASNSIIIAYVARQFRLQNIAPGEAVVHDASGQWVHIRADGSINVKATNRVDVDAPLTYCTGDMHVAGNLTVGGDAGIGGAADVAGALTGASVATAGGIDLAGHIHTGDDGGNTSPPQDGGGGGGSSPPPAPPPPQDPPEGSPELPPPPPGGYQP